MFPSTVLRQCGLSLGLPTDGADVALELLRSDSIQVLWAGPAEPREKPPNGTDPKPERKDLGQGGRLQF